MPDLRAQLHDTLGSAYSIERELGGGGMSRVFLAEETALGRKVVVKVLPPDLIAGVNVERFKREIQVAARLQHAHIVPVLTAGETEGAPYYTMPFVEGESLRARIARTGPLPIAEAIGVLRDVAKALAYAHERGLVHRDIKPDNVMLSGGSAMVVDFGIAKAISAARTDAPNATLTQVGTAIGTPAYMAPEQAAGDPATDHRADIYAFGCMAYEALAGRPPFVATSPMKLLAAHMSETPQPVSTLRPDTPETLAALIHGCLEKEPEKRPQSAADVARMLDTVTSGGSAAMPAILMSGPGMLKKALALYALAAVVVAIVAKAAIVAIGLPEWVLPGSMAVMAMGLPVILFTGYVHHTARHLAAMTPQLTPGGTQNAPQGTMRSLAVKASPHMSWRRTMFGGAYALAAFIVLVGTFMLLRALGIGPAGSLLAAGSITAREPLLVTDFKVTNADTTLGRVLSDAAKTQLAQSSVITLLPADAVADALRRMTRPVNSNLDFALARELAQRNGIKAIVDGDLTGLGSAGYIVTMKLVTADSARELASFRQTASTAQGLIEAVDALARQLRGRVGESLKRVNDAPRLAVATTSSIDALRKYTEGVRAEELLGKRDDAIALLTEAVTIDSTFAEAWRKLGVVKQNGGRPQSERDSAFAAAYRHRNRVPENVRHWIVAAYYNNGPGRDRGRAAEAYEAALRGGDSTVDNNLALLYVTRRQFALAETLYRARERRGGFRIVYGNLVSAQMRLGKFAAAESTVARGIAEFPDLKQSLERTLVDAKMRNGDTAGFRKIVDSMYTRSDSLDRVWARGRVLNLVLLDGQYSRWLDIVTPMRAAPAVATREQKLNWAINQIEVWCTAVWRRQPAAVEKRLDSALANYPGRIGPNGLVNIAISYSRAERPDKGREYLRRLEADLKDTTLKRTMAPEIALTTGEVLLAEGKGLEAAEAFRRADRLPDGPAHGCGLCLSIGLARAYDLAANADSAIKHYERYVSTYDFERVSTDILVLATFSRRLGELYEQKGDREKAARYYRDFVNLWKNADPDLQPQVAEVRRRLSRLADVEPAQPGRQPN